MATARTLFGIICFTGIFCYGLPKRHLLENPSIKLIAIAQSQIGVRESSKNNHGLVVASYLAYTHLKEGNPWCAAFVSWVYAKAGYPVPKTAWSPALFPASKKVKEPKSGDVFGIYYTSLKRIAHCGLVEKTQHNWIISIEGNTNTSGGGNGDGVYRRWRHEKTIYAFARWLPNQKGVKHE